MIQHINQYGGTYMQTKAPSILIKQGRTKWAGLFKRIFDELKLERFPRYKDCSIVKEWMNRETFVDWYTSQPFTDPTYQLDKDIILKGNTIYSPEMCSLVPPAINYFFTKTNASRGRYPIGVTFHTGNNRFRSYIKIDGIKTILGYYKTPEEAFFKYKKAKEFQSKILADRWKDRLDPRVYDAMIRYTVAITD